jgi:hypothetical protein
VERPLEHADDDSTDDIAGVARAGEPPGCLQTGAHHILLPDADGERAPWNAKIEGHCIYCGIEKFFPARYRRNGRGRRGSRQAPQRRAGAGTRVAAPKPLRVKRVGDEPTHTVAQLVEALTYQRRGPWAAFESLALQVSDAPWFALETARLMSALGHIELRLDPSTQRPESWALMPATLASTAVDGRAALCGARNEGLLTALGERASELGGDLLVEGGADDLPLVLIEGLEPEALDALAVAASTDEMPVAVSVAPGARLAATLQPLSGILPLLTRFVPPIDRSLERWDAKSGAWERAADVDRPGAYRTTSFPRRYGVHLPEAEARQLQRGDARLVKWLAARSAGVSLLAYDKSARELTCLLGAEPPGLYERAVALCGGRPPAQRDGTIVYCDVAEPVASAVWEALTT